MMLPIKGRSVRSRDDPSAESLPSTSRSYRCTKSKMLIAAIVRPGHDFRMIRRKVARGSSQPFYSRNMDRKYNTALHGSRGIVTNGLSPLKGTPFQSRHLLPACSG